MYSRYYHIVLT